MRLREIVNLKVNEKVYKNGVPMKKLMMVLVLPFILSGCDFGFSSNKLPSLEGAPDYIDEACIVFFGTGGEQVLDIGELPGIPKGTALTVQSATAGGTELQCFDWNYTKQVRTSEPVFREPDPRRPMYAMSVTAGGTELQCCLLYTSPSPRDS